MRDNARAARIVGFWRKIEIFSTQSIPKLTQRNTEDVDEFVVDVSAGELAPWQKDHPLTSKPIPPKRAWQYTVYGGRYELSTVRSQLVKIFGDNGKYAESRSAGETALFAFTLDDEGYLVENSAVLSACAWAIGRVVALGKENPRWLEGFEQEEDEFSHGLNKLVPPDSHRPSGRASAASAIMDKVGDAVVKQAKGATKEAATAGAKATGAAVTTAATIAVGSLAGPIVGGIAGAVAGTFVTKLLSPQQDDKAKGAGGETSTDKPQDPATAGKDAAGTKQREWVPRYRLTSRSLHEFVDELAAALTVADSLAPVGIRVHAKLGWVSDGESRDDKPFLNSLIANDLAKIEVEVRDGRAGAGLTSYLADNRDIPLGHRVDVRKNLDTVIGRVAPLRAPAGRWPTDIGKPLVLSQQFAVNEIISQLGASAGVFAVNGPPGTGKTTMLRDVLAAVVTARAQQLATLKNPLDAFVGDGTPVPVTKTYSPKVRAIRPDLTGFEIVVATAGNEAAKNVTAEIPSLSAVKCAEDEAVAINYFTELATDVLRAPCWGLLAAPLGNMKYRGIFKDRFWWGVKHDNKKKPQAGGDQATPDEDDQDEQGGMLGILQRAKLTARTPQDWATAVADFHKASSEVARLVQERQWVAEAIDSLKQLDERVRLGEEQIRFFAQRCQAWQNAVAEERKGLDKAAKDHADADAVYDKHVGQEPGFWVIVFSLGKEFKQWRTRRNDLAEVRDAAKALVAGFGMRIAQHEQGLAYDFGQQQQHDHALYQVRTERAGVLASIEAARERWPGTVPFLPSFANEEQLQLCAPWADVEFTTARNRLFLAALSLHKTFILHAAARLQPNLAVIAAVIGGKLNPQPAREQLLAAWQSLFLVMPMVSTTFASLPRLFAGLGKESFGWLFIDEAGQATPQQAVGGIWRAQRSVIVGDPQQLEPIVTLPSPAQQALLRDQQIDEQWLPDITSAQRVCDRLALFGTALPEQDGDAEVWVGAPLRVHRRCDRPMFDIANNIAYGGTLMIYGTELDGEFPGENAWIDIRSQQSKDNWIPAEGDALVRLLSELRNSGVALSDIRVISPFRKVVSETKTLLRQRVDRAFADNNVGTVHTVQGKESPVIILILGSAPNNDRARAWAAEKPNLLNVAVSRAKRRLYVIGNREKWQDQRYFDQLAATVPAR